MFGRSTVTIGFLLLALAAPVTAQTPAPADREARANNQSKPAEQASPKSGESARQEQPHVAPPAARSGDEFDLPPSTGCQYRGNKLDLLV